MARAASSLLTGIILAAAPQAACARTIESPINGKSLALSSGRDGYSFLLIGHAYGAHNRSVYPSASLIGSVDRINAMRPRFVVLLGDMLQRVRPPDIEAFKRTVGRKIDAPIFNALGNHDAGGRELYARHFGKESFFSFRIGSELFVFLDSELHDGRIRGEQLGFVLDEIDRARRSSEIRNVFIFSHRLLWAVGNPPLDKIIPFVNGPDFHRPELTDFTEKILPKLRDLGGRRVFLAAGDVGAAWSLPLFFEKDRAAPLHYMATGLGDTEKDSFIRVDVLGGGERVELSAVSLTGLGPPEQGGRVNIERFGVEDWLGHFKARERLKRRKGAPRK